MNGYYVYRFINYDDDIVYVGRTVNLLQRFTNHSFLTDAIKKIEYITCRTYADMVWKEIYYINLFANECTINTKDVYEGGVTFLNMKDEWKTYIYDSDTYKLDPNRITVNQELLKNEDLINKIPLIHIVEYEKINSIGEKSGSLSRKWFYDDKNEEQLDRLGKHVTNYFHNICHAKSAECLWTTYDELKSQVRGKCFRKGFISLNNDNRTKRKYLAFLCNLYYPPQEKIDGVSESDYALSEMLQFIWRSAIRDGKEIWVYIPSIRMRQLFQRWIEENSPANRE